MNERVIFYTIIGTNVLLYVLAFSLAFIKKQNMTSYVTLLIIESVITLLFISLYSGGGDPMGKGFLLVFFTIILIVLTLALVIAIFVKMPSSHTAAYILIIIGFSLAISFAIDAIMERESEKQSEAIKKEKQTLYDLVSEKGELLLDNRRWSEIYYFNNALYGINFDNSDISLIYVRELDLNVNENDYIRVYEVNKKYILMLAKSALDEFDDWIVYVEKVGYMHLEKPNESLSNPWCGSAKEIIEKNEYIILDEDIHTKIQEKEKREEEERRKYQDEIDSWWKE